MSHFRSRRPRSGAASQQPAHFQERAAASPPPKAVTPPSVEELGAIAASPFTALGLRSSIVRSVVAEGYDQPTPVQAQVIPLVLSRNDVLACAQTGTGKTAAFVLPLLELFSAELAAGGASGQLRVLVLAPTRELAAQIGESVAVYGRHLSLRHAVIYGGVSQHRQELALRARPEILVATPGRLLDLMQQKLVRFDHLTHFVLDEADRMLDMGFLPDVRRIANALPQVRQTLLFSATMPPPIEALARTMLVNPSRVAITPAATTVEAIEQSVVFVAKSQKTLLLKHLLGSNDISRAIVFTRTKHGANRVSEQLDRGGISAAAIHGNKSQNARERALEGFRTGRTRVLVATDIAARGIDVDGVTHVINFDLPQEPESYVHRIGRTGRAGAVGQAISFCDSEERALLKDIERVIRKRVAVFAPEVPGLQPDIASVEARPADLQNSRNYRSGSGNRRFDGRSRSRA